MLMILYIYKLYYGGNKLKITINTIIGIIILTILICIGFYIWFSVGMRSTNSVKPIETSYINIYKDDIKKEISEITEVSVYYQQGRICFDFTADSSMTLDKCKSVVKKTKEFIETEGVTHLLPKGFGVQDTIKIEFDTLKNIYSFESPYFIPTKDTYDNPNNSEENNYNVWYLSVNNEQAIQIEL